jgi:hypothetical protein
MIFALLVAILCISFQFISIRRPVNIRLVSFGGLVGLDLGCVDFAQRPARSIST